jgi:hypothetical protein
VADEDRSTELVTLDLALLRAELRDALRETLPELVPSPPPASPGPDQLAAAIVRRLPRGDASASREALETVRRHVADLGDHVQRLGDEQRGFAAYLRREDRERGWSHLAVAALVGLALTYLGLLALPGRFAGRLVGAPEPAPPWVGALVQQNPALGECAKRVAQSGERQDCGYVRLAPPSHANHTS